MRGTDITLRPSVGAPRPIEHRHGIEGRMSCSLWLGSQRSYREKNMRTFSAHLLVCAALLISGCSGHPQGLLRSATNQVTLASSHQATLLQAEVTMMFLSYVAAETSDRTAAQAVAAVSALNEAALAIDCMRGDAAKSGWAKDWNTGCGNPGDERFFYTKLLTVARSLLALARASLPDANLGSLLSALPQASANPLALVTPLLGVAMDAAVIVPRGAAAYLDYRDIIVTAYCSMPVHLAEPNCEKTALERLRRDATQGQTIPIDSKVFEAARGLTKVNCTRLAERTKFSTAITIDCKLGV